MRKTLLIALVAVIGMLQVGCTLVGNQTDLKAVAERQGMINITTGDGTFENYQATNYASAKEIGIAVGIPFLWKIMELYPAQSNEDLLSEVAAEAKAHGADAMINVTAPQECYWGFPFFIIGIYVDKTDGTGIDVK